MRLLIQAAFVLFAFPALAQTAVPVPRPTTAQPYPPRVPLPERFAEANTTKDGRLTKAQAAASNWYYVNREFNAIDKDHKGYVTVQDIRDHARDMRELRRAAEAAPSKS